MPRILHLRTVSGTGGGPEKTLLASPRALEHRYRMRLFYIYPTNDPTYDMPERARRNSVDFKDVAESSPVDPRTLLRLVKEVRGYRPHLLHAHDYKTNLLALGVARWFRIPVVTTLHGYVTVGGRLNWYYRLDRATLRRMDHVVAVSEDLYQMAADEGIKADCRTLLHNGIDTSAFQRTLDRPTIKKQLGFAADRLLVGAVGRLQEEKGFVLLIEAAIELLNNGANFDLVIAGDGPLRSKLAWMIQRSGHESRIRLLGHRTDIQGIYQAMDVFVLSSLREGLPNVLLEAMSLEIPVIATQVGGVPHVVENDVSGLLIRAGEREELTSALLRMLNDGSRRERLARGARQVVEQRYSFARRMETLGDVYDAVLKANARA